MPARALASAALATLRPPPRCPRPPSAARSPPFPQTLSCTSCLRLHSRCSCPPHRRDNRLRIRRQIPALPPNPAPIVSADPAFARVSLPRRGPTAMVEEHGGRGEAGTSGGGGEARHPQHAHGARIPQGGVPQEEEGRCRAAARATTEGDVEYDDDDSMRPTAEPAKEEDIEGAVCSAPCRRAVRNTTPSPSRDMVDARASTGGEDPTAVDVVVTQLALHRLRPPLDFLASPIALLEDCKYSEHHRCQNQRSDVKGNCCRGLGSRTGGRARGCGPPSTCPSRRRSCRSKQSRGEQSRAAQIETSSRPSRAPHLHLGHPLARVEDELLLCLRQLCAPCSAACLPRPQGGCVGVASDNAKAPSRPSRALCLHQVAHPSKWRTSSSSTASRPSSSPRTHPQPRSIARSEPARHELHRGTDPISAPGRGLNLKHGKATRYNSTKSVSMQTIISCIALWVQSEIGREFQHRFVSIQTAGDDLMSDRYHLRPLTR
eukprot:XP_008665022.1 uncharacterized protein LOC103643639 isoform X3 [Zea mays]